MAPVDRGSSKELIYGVLEFEFIRRRSALRVFAEYR